jgi:hypothetical protein
MNTETILSEILRTGIASDITRASVSANPSGLSWIGSLLLSVNPISPVNWVIYLIMLFVMVLGVLEKKNSKRQWKKGAELALIPYIFVAVPINYLFVMYMLPFMSFF